MNEIYIVVWGGAYEAPSYVAKRTQPEAIRQAEAWFADADEDEGDYVDVLRLNLNTLSMERVQVPA